MKVLRNICPLLFLLLSLACAAYTTVQIREYQRNLPGGVLAVLDKEEGAEQDFLIVEKEDGSPLYKNGAVEEIQKKYGITVSEDDLTELDPVKSLLSQSWKLCRRLFSGHVVYMEGSYEVYCRRVYGMQGPENFKDNDKNMFRGFSVSGLCWNLVSSDLFY